MYDHGLAESEAVKLAVKYQHFGKSCSSTRIKIQQVLLKLWYVSNIFQGITSWKTATLIHTAMGNLNLIKLTCSYAEKQE
jgi:hypothetical protein